jgi:hypothetical protein
MKQKFQPSVKKPESVLTCHSGGINEVVNTIMVREMMKEIKRASQKRLRILGTSMKKLDLSTSFLVAPHVMSKENRCARRATER